MTRSGDEGSQPHADARFALANERTLLAWVRTALALLAAAAAVQQFADLQGSDLLAILLAVTGLIAAAAGGWRYRRTAIALARGDVHVEGVAPTALAAAVTIVGVLLLIVLLVSL